MSKNDKDWTFVNEDGSVEALAKNGRESDSDQDFEVLAKPGNMVGLAHNVVQFKGIFIKEDHFADGMKDDGSDIEVLKRSPKIKEDLFSASDTDDKESIEIVESSYDDHNAMQNGHWSLLESDLIDAANSSDSDYEKVQQLDDTLTSNSIEGIEDIASLFLENEAEDKPEGSDSESENEYDGLHLLFGKDNGQVTGVQFDLDALFKKLDDVSNNFKNNNHRNDTKVTDDGIVLSTSMFIILLCLSVSTGLIIGKGLMCLSQMYSQENTASLDAPAVPSPTHLHSRKTTVDDDATKKHEMLVKEMLKNEDAQKDAFDVRLAYQEMQVKYHQLQRKYSYLGQQYQIQKQILLFSKKMKNLNDIKLNSSNDQVNHKNRSNVQKELLWWKMRASVWRRKYLDLKVQFLEAKKNLSLVSQTNVTFKACAGLLTEYIPELNMTALLKSETSARIASSAKMCWKRVLSPVRAVSDRMGSSLFGFSRRMDGFWEQVKKKWDKKPHQGRQNSGDSKGKLSSKWRRFRKMFSMSNIIGSLKFNDEQQRTQKSLHEDDVMTKEYCEAIPHSKRSNENSVEKDEDVSYLPPQSKGDANMPPEKSDNSPPKPIDFDGMDVEILGPNVFSLRKRGFKECEMEIAEKNPSSSRLETKKGKLKERYESFENKMRHQSNKIRKKEEELKRKLGDFELYENKKREDIASKREILENKMRKHSNRKRSQERILKKREQKLKNIVKNLEKKFEYVFEKKAKELELKRKRLEKKLKNLIKKNIKERKVLDKEKAKFKKRANKLQLKLKRNEEELAKKRKEFESWNAEMKQKMMQESSSRQHMGEQKLKAKETAMMKKMAEKIKRKEEKLERKESVINIKLDQLRSALRRLVKEEQARTEEIAMKNNELRKKQNQVDMMKLFYGSVLKQEKEKHAKAKETVLHMKQRIINLNEMHKEITKKYKIVQENLAKERKHLGREESMTVTHKPTVYCPDQHSCQGLNVRGYTVTKVTHKSTGVPLVFCPDKDNCQGDKSKFRQFGEFEKFFREKNWQWDAIQAEAKVLKKNTALRPVPPHANDVAKVNPFFFSLNIQNNETSSDAGQHQPEGAKPKQQQQEKHEKQQDSKWYFNLMQERAKQRAIPWSWYLYWSQGRTGWRNAVGKEDGDNWYLKAMHERERQRGTPVDWYFKRGKGKVEDSVQSSWLINRGIGREDARKKEGVYYCW